MRRRGEQVLVTGATGFIGTRLVENLLADGIRVRVLVRPGPHPAALRPRPDGIEYVTAGYDDPAALGDALRGITAVFHLGGVTKAVRHEEYYSGNAESTRALLETITRRRGPGLARFLLVSSHAAAGPARSPELPSREDDVPRPIEAYGRAKLAAERVALGFAGRVPVTIVRPPTVYGPGDRDCLALFRQARYGLRLFYGNANKYTGLVFVDDLVAGIRLAATHPRAVGRTYFICNEGGIRWRDFQNAVARAVGRRTVAIHLPAWSVWPAALAGELMMRLDGKARLVNLQKARLGKPRYWIMSGERAACELGFRPTGNLAENLRRTAAWYRAAGWLRE